MRKFIVAMCLLVAGCSSSSGPTKVFIESIFIDGGGYKVLVRQDDGSMKFENYASSSNLIIKDDVSDDEKSWIKVERNFQSVITEIHVQDVDELQGGKSGGKHPHDIIKLE